MQALEPVILAIRQGRLKDATESYVAVTKVKTEEAQKIVQSWFDKQQERNRKRRVRSVKR